MQKYGLKFKMLLICVLVLALFMGGCVAVYYGMRYKCEQELGELLALETDTPESSAAVIDGISDLLKDSFFLNHDMLYRAMDKLTECQSSAHSYIDVLSASINSLLYAHAIGDEEAIASGSISLGDCCIMLGAYNDAEMIFSQVLLRRLSDPALADRTYAAAELGLAKICVSTNRNFQAHEHIISCLEYARRSNLEKYFGYAEAILAEIQYSEQAYEGCAARVSRILPENDVQTLEDTQKFTLPLLSLRALTSAQSGDFAAAEQSTSRFITVADRYKLDAVIAKHLYSLKTVYAQKGEPFPSAFADELLESYRVSAEKNIGFITEYALIEYIYFYKESTSFQNSFAFIALLVLLPVLFLLQLIVRLIIKAQTDPLTGLLNRSSFARGCRAAARKKKAAFIMFDVDDFKQINDSHGHAVGDAVLIRVAKEMYRRCGTGCRVYRIGGEEFAIIISNTKRFPPYTLAESIRRGVQSLKWREEGLSVTVSAGVSDDHSSDLYRRADEKLYYSKAHGKNRIS